VKERIAVLDVLRGLAIIGTLGTNIWIFTDPLGPSGFLTHMPDPSTFAGQVEALLRSAANGKFLALLTLLFGIGLELQYRSALRRGARWPGWYLWRAALLFVEGLVHFVLVFEYDVLMSYAVTAMVVAYLIGRSDRAIRIWMVAAGSLHVAVVGLVTLAWVSAPPEAAAPAPIGRPDVFATGTYAEQVSERLAHWLDYRIEAIFIIPSSIVLFLLGAKLFRAGVFEPNPAGVRLRRIVMVAGFGVAAPLSALTSLGGPEWFLLERYVLAPFVALGIVGLVTTIVLRMRRPAGPLRTGFTTVGRTALSCYVFQNLVGSLLCYGWGFGLAVRLEHLRPWWVVGGLAGITALFTLGSWLWLRTFPRGPLEWVWHWAYTKPQRHPAPATTPDPALRQ